MRFTHIRFQFNFLSDCSRQRMPIATTYITFIIKYNIIHIDINGKKDTTRSIVFLLQMCYGN